MPSPAELRDRAQRFGPAHVVTAGALRASRLAAVWLEDRLLELEQRRRTIGPAHAGWSGHEAEANRERFDGWDWSAGGEEWTLNAAWKQSLIDEVLLPTIPPGGTVLEIGPGGGRWTGVLADRADRLVVLDIAQAALDATRERLGERDDVEYVLTDGPALPSIEDASVDAVWSFDVWVHIAPLDQAAYLAELARVMRPGAVAAIHHADGRDRGRQRSRSGWRAPMSAGLFAELAGRAGLRLERHVREWGAGHDLSAYGDVISVLRR